MPGPNLQAPAPQVGAYTDIGDIAALGTTQMTELAHTYEQFHGNPLMDLFHVRNVEQSVIMIERMRMGVGIAPLVRMGGVDRMTDSPTIEQRYVAPLTIRESDFIPQHVINILRQPGTPNQRWGEQQVQMRVQRLTQRSNFFWQVMMAKVLVENGINYTDPRTGESVSVSSGIPSTNIKTLVGSGNEFENLTTAKPIDVLRFFRGLLRNIAKATPDTLIMSSELRDILTLNTQVIARQEGFGAGPITQFVRFEDGDLVSIAGLKIRTVDTIYEDPATGLKKKLWPIDKVVVLVTNHAETPGVKIGRMDYCMGESPDGGTGLWVRDGGPTLPPYAPGRAIQMGNTGMPYLFNPDWAGILTVGDKAALEALIPQTI